MAFVVPLSPWRAPVPLASPRPGPLVLSPLPRPQRPASTASTASTASSARSRSTSPASPASPQSPQSPVQRFGSQARQPFLEQVEPVRKLLGVPRLITQWLRTQAVAIPNYTASRPIEELARDEEACAFAKITDAAYAEPGHRPKRLEAVVEGRRLEVELVDFAPEDLAAAAAQEADGFGEPTPPEEWFCAYASKGPDPVLVLGFRGTQTARDEAASHRLSNRVSVLEWPRDPDGRSAVKLARFARDRLPRHTIFVTGHSLGGTRAAAAAMILREGRAGSDEPIRGHLFNPGCGVLGGLTVEHHMRDREIAVESLTSHIVYGDYICACWMWPCKRYLPRSASAGGAWAAAALEYVLPSQAWSRGYKDQDAHRLTNFTDEIPGFVSARRPRAS